MTLLFTLTYYDPYVSGLTICVKRLAEGLAKHGSSVHVLCMRHTKTIPLKETIHHVSVTRARSTLRFHKGFLSFDWVKQAYALIQTSDVIVVNLPQVEGFIAACFAKCFGKRVIAVYHCELVLPRGIRNRCIQFGVELANRIACFFSDTIITYTDDYARHSRVLLPFRKKIQSIYPPIPVPRVSLSTKKKLTKLIGSHKLVIGIAARLAAEKGIEYVFEALHYLPKDTMIVVAGPTEHVGEEKYKKKILDLVSSNVSQIVFLGTLTQDEMGAFYSLIDVLVVSSINSTEAFGLVQVEAMLCKVPVVATDLPGVRVPIQQTHMGIVVPPKNAKAIAEAIGAIVKKKKSYILPTTTIQTIFSYEKTINAYKRCFIS